jgi:hypothetical protein
MVERATNAKAPTATDLICPAAKSCFFIVVFWFLLIPAEQEIDGSFFVFFFGQPTKAIAHERPDGYLCLLLAE